MKIKAISRIVHEIKYIKSVFNYYSPVLVRGRYHQHRSFCSLSLDNAATREKSRLHFDKYSCGKIMVFVIKILNFINFYNNKNKNSTEEYDAFYTANNYDEVREVKLFSFKNGKMLTVCASKERADKQLEQYETLGWAYNMPSVKKNCKYETSFEISMVQLMDYESEALALENIWSSTVAYNDYKKELTGKSVYELVSFSYDDEINNYLQRIVDRISPSLMDTKIPFCLQHGDLSKDNLIYGKCDGKTDFWWIDWEHVKSRVFFYDYFFYIINSAFYGDMEAFECYIKGEEDVALEKFFTHFGVHFDKDKKFDYFLIFSIAFLIERVCPVGGLPVLKRYYELIEKMEAYTK